MLLEVAAAFLTSWSGDQKATLLPLACVNARAEYVADTTEFYKNATAAEAGTGAFVDVKVRILAQYENVRLYRKALSRALAACPGLFSGCAILTSTKEANRCRGVGGSRSKPRRRR